MKHLDDIELLISESVKYCDARLVDLGVTNVLIKTNVPDFTGFRYFANTTPVEMTWSKSPYVLHCIDLDSPGSLDERIIEGKSDHSFRGRRFLTGAYLTQHFGPPAALVIRDRRIYILGRQLDRIVWAWFIKYLLTVNAIQERMLHVKASCLSVNGGGALLIGRSQGGKTVLLTQMCSDQATFVSNTHVVLDGSHGYGVPTTLRIRDDDCFRDLIRSHRVTPHIEMGEFVADPGKLFERRCPHTPIGHVCVVDYDTRRKTGIHEIDPDDTYHMFEQFGLPINTYGIKDDILEFCRGDLARFVEVYTEMKERLRTVVESASCWYVNCDMMQAKNRKQLHSYLGQ